MASEVDQGAGHKVQYFYYVIAMSVLQTYLVVLLMLLLGYDPLMTIPVAFTMMLMAWIVVVITLAFYKG